MHRKERTSLSARLQVVMAPVELRSFEIIRFTEETTLRLAGLLEGLRPNTQSQNEWKRNGNGRVKETAPTSTGNLRVPLTSGERLGGNELGNRKKLHSISLDMNNR